MITKAPVVLTPTLALPLKAGGGNIGVLLRADEVIE